MSDALDVFLPNGYLDRALVTPGALASLDEAVAAARATRWEMVRTPHLFVGIVAVPDRTVSLWARQAGLDLIELDWKFRQLMRLPGTIPTAPRLHREFLSKPAITALRTANTRREEHDRAQITPADLLWAVLAQDGCVTGRLSHGGLPAPVLRVLLAEADRSHIEPSGSSQPR
jgi:hypothetical protein